MAASWEFEEGMADCHYVQDGLWLPKDEEYHTAIHNQ